MRKPILVATVFCFRFRREVGPLRLAAITDGTSNTFAVAEAVALSKENFGSWACGLNCISHDDGSINNRFGGLAEIASLHPGGANVLLADGATRFVGESVSLDVLGPLCIRDDGNVAAVN